MHNAAPRQCRHFRCMCQQPVNKGAAVMSCSWMHHKPRGLVQYDHMLILIQDV